MTWQYTAGYADGEGCLGFAINHMKGKCKRPGSNVDGFTISPGWRFGTYDFEVLDSIRNFLLSNRIKVAKIYNYPFKRKNRFGKVSVLQVLGWENLSNLLTNIMPYSISKKEQYALFKGLYQFWLNRTKDSYNTLWTKETFIEAMNMVDKINSLKGGKRGKYNAEYFKRFWNIE